MLTGLTYAVTSVLFLVVVLPRMGTEMFPAAEAGQFQLRLRAPTGTRIERTELVALKALDVIRREAGPGNVAITTGFIGVQPASYPINPIYLWTSGPHEAVLRVALKPIVGLRGEEFQERLRARLREALPGVSVSFEAGDIVSQVMSFGSPTPVEVAVQGPTLSANLKHAGRVRAELGKIPSLRDLQYAQPLDYPTVDVRVDRDRAGQFGLTMADVARSMVAATSSSRFVEPNYWRDPASGNAFQVQVEIPQHKMGSLEDIRDVPLMNSDTFASGPGHPLLGDVAELRYGTTPGLIMATGIAVANAILLVTFAEMSRREGRPVAGAALEGGRGRLRAVLMTASAMVAGMVPIALGFGEAGEQTAPLGRAVIGGLIVATVATLTVLPSVYAILQRRAGTHSASLDPNDPSSRYYEPE